MAKITHLLNELGRLREEAPTIAEAAQYIGKPSFGVKKVKLELLGTFDSKPS